MPKLANFQIKVGKVLTLIVDDEGSCAVNRYGGSEVGDASIKSDQSLIVGAGGGLINRLRATKIALLAIWRPDAFLKD